MSLFSLQKADTVFDIGHLFCFISSINQLLTFFGTGFALWRVEIKQTKYGQRDIKRGSAEGAA